MLYMQMKLDSPKRVIWQAVLNEDGQASYHTKVALGKGHGALHRHLPTLHCFKSHIPAFWICERWNQGAQLMKHQEPDVDLR
jgi:hypothetical protein